MGFLSSAEAVILRSMAACMVPPPPPDITRWCEDNIVFNERSPLPGPFRRDAFAFLQVIHEVLSPEHPCREVTIRGSSQIGKTASIIQPTLAAWHTSTSLDSLVVHPTMSAAADWVNTKWMPMRRQAPDLMRIFGAQGTGDKKDTTFNQETLDRNGSLKVASAGSPADLTGTSRRLVVLDDLSKYEMTEMGDPEALAVSRASGFEDAKILRVSTAMIEETCRITRAFLRGDQRHYHVPCPHCGTFAPLTWENFKRSLDPEALDAAHFTCEACQKPILHGDKQRIVAAGKWVAHNPRGDHPSFHLWRAYAPMRDWASIAQDYALVMGWSLMTASSVLEDGLKAKVDAQTEQTFYNDVLGLPYAQASRGPDWTALRDRVENADAAEADILPIGILPATGFLLTAGVDCQLDRTEVHVVAFTENLQRHTVAYTVIPHHIGDQEAWDALDALLKSKWRTTLGRRVGLDMMAIDVGTYTDDVWGFGKRHPWSRVILVKGSSSQTGPTMVPMKFERRRDGQAKRAAKRAFMLNVSQMKADFYAHLAKEDPLARGHVGFAAGLGDEFYRQITSEVRVLKRSRSGVVTSQWDLVEPTRRNEGLDTMIYAEAAARRKGWASMTPEEWSRLADDRGAPPDDAQIDLFDASATSVMSATSDRSGAQGSLSERAAQAIQPPKRGATEGKPGREWLGRGKKEWF